MLVLLFIPAQLLAIALPAAQPVYHLTGDRLRQAVALDHAATALHFGSELWRLIVLWLFLASGTASRLAARVERKGGRRLFASAVYGALVVTMVFVTAYLPPLAFGHAVALHYGLSVQSWISWLRDASITLRIAAVTYTLLFMLAYALLRRSPRHYWLWFAGALVPLTFAGAYVVPLLIDPMYNQYEPLAATHPQLVEQLERVVARTGTRIPPERMFLMRASAKSTGINATVTGLGATKRIIVWDTTADLLPTDQILFIFAHESGHYVLNHLVKGLLLAIAGAFALLGLTAWLAARLVARFGSHWGIASLVSLPGLVVLLLALAALQSLTEPVANTVSRAFEHQADVYGQEAIHGLVPNPQATAVSAFTAIGAHSLDDPFPNPFVEFWTYDHPSTQSRATFAAGYDPWAAGQRPRYFPPETDSAPGHPPLH